MIFFPAGLHLQSPLLLQFQIPEGKNWTIMLKLSVVYQHTQTHNTKHVAKCLDVFQKISHTLLCCECWGCISLMFTYTCAVMTGWQLLVVLVPKIQLIPATKPWLLSQKHLAISQQIWVQSSQTTINTHSLLWCLIQQSASLVWPWKYMYCVRYTNIQSI